MVSERLAEEPTAPSADSAPPQDAGVALDVVLLALKVLGQRTMAIATHAYPVLALGAAAAMWWRVMDAPTPYQLVGLGLFGVFLLAMQVLRSRK